MTRDARLLITCEHGGNEIPNAARSAFDSPIARQHLQSHRGWDPGALEAARFLAKYFRAPFHHCSVSRLVVDLNRSEDHPELFSRFTRALPGSKRTALLRRHYHPYRDAVSSRVGAIVDQGRLAVHVSVHSFTPVFRGQRRKMDIGLLFDPRRRGESVFCRRWKTQLGAPSPKLRIAMNQPYLGIDDGLTSALRTRFPDEDYLGIELEINNRFARRTTGRRMRLLEHLAQTLAGVMVESRAN